MRRCRCGVVVSTIGYHARGLALVAAFGGKGIWYLPSLSAWNERGLHLSEVWFATVLMTEVAGIASI